ncbi:MAG: hypothetical protein GY856_47205 [bacterium]|nr:hypothetical protein [bacterium]
MSKKSLGMLVVIIGILLLLGSLTADYAGIGRSPGVGWLQTLGAVVGVVLAVVGLLLLRWKQPGTQA